MHTIKAATQDSTSTGTQAR